MTILDKKAKTHVFSFVKTIDRIAIIYSGYFDK